MKYKFENTIKRHLDDVYNYKKTPYGEADTWAEFKSFNGLITGLWLADGISTDEYYRLFKLGENALKHAREVTK